MTLLGEQISNVREKLKQGALREANNAKNSEIAQLKDGAKKIIKNITRGYAKRFCMKSKEIDGLGREYDAYPTNVKRCRRRNVLTAGENLDIAYHAIVEK